MSTYRVYLQTVASACITVDAEDAGEAEEKAWQEIGPPDVCAQCAGWGQGPGIELGEWETESVEKEAG